MRAAFDTNIVIDRLQGHPVAKALTDSMDDAYISLVTHMEVMVGISPNDGVSRANAERLFAIFEIVGIDEVSDLAVRTRQDTKDKLPDAIIHATALKLGIPLYTRDKGIRPVTFMQDIDLLQSYSSHDTPQQQAAIIAAIRATTSH